MTYGTLPVLLGTRKIEVQESMFYLYMPILLKGELSKNWVILPERLKIFKDLIDECIYDWVNHTCEQLSEHYIYITVKHMLVTPNYWGNRPGYHSDGFMTNDINYIWSDCNPTIFNCTDFKLTMDENISMFEMEQQAIVNKERTYPDFSLLRLNQYNIHKVAPVTENRMRTFVKISFSKDKYDLIGNTHNHLLNYQWEMKKRCETRNVPQSNQEK